MKLEVLFFWGFVGCAATLHAGQSEKDIDKVVDDSVFLETSQPGIRLSGYFDVGYGYHFNHGPMTRNPADGGTVLPVFPAKAQFSRGGDFNVNAVKLSLEKALSPKDEFSAGFRADVMLGEDAGFFGGNPGASTLSSDSLFLEQGYVSLRVPVGNGLDFKVGKFVSLMGFEVMERPANLNISYGNLFQNMIPFHHTGILASYAFDEQISADFGIVNGWNSSTGFGQDNRSDSVAFTGALTWKNKSGNATVHQSFIVSPWGDPGAIPDTFSPGSSTVTDDQFVGVYDVWATWSPEAAKDKLLLAVNADFGVADSTLSRQGIKDGTTWWGLAGYAKYEFNSFWSLAFRSDYIHNDDSQKFQGTNTTFGFTVPGSMDVWGQTLTLGMNLAENVLLRTEYRVDYGSDLQTEASVREPANGGFANSCLVELVYTF